MSTNVHRVIKPKGLRGLCRPGLENTWQACRKWHARRFSLQAAFSGVPTHFATDFVYEKTVYDYHYYQMMLRVSLLYKSDAVRSYGLPTQVSYGCFQLFCSLCLPVIIIKMAIPNYAAQNSRGKEQKSPKFGHQTPVR
jgi:hypothetical protein